MKIEKIKKEPKRYVVYVILNNFIPIYVGYTGSLKTRQYQHNRLFNNGYKKDLYSYLRDINFKDKIELIPIKEFKKKIDAKRWECLMIIQDYFGDKVLKQKVPNISDR